MLTAAMAEITIAAAAIPIRTRIFIKHRYEILVK
jgi:hypothetical protein